MSKLIISQEGEVLTCHFFSRFVSFDILEWMLLEQVDDCEQLPIFLTNEKWNVFSLDKDYLEFVAKYPMRNIVVHK
jgi:hypothetical protein